MSPTRRTDPELDDLIADIITDAYDEDEALMGFENAFDEADCFPCPGTVIGEAIEILSVSTSNGRSELIANCQRAGSAGRRHQIALLDIDINTDQSASRLLAAYRRWTGAETGTT